MILAQEKRQHEQEPQARKRYIWKIGVLGWGGTMFAVVTWFDWYQAGYSHVPPLPSFLRLTIPNLIIWPIAGYFWGAWTWKQRSKTRV